MQTRDQKIEEIYHSLTHEEKVKLIEAIIEADDVMVYDASRDCWSEIDHVSIDPQDDYIVLTI